jgi:MYXO-CTERM domain-containing protein
MRKAAYKLIALSVLAGTPLFASAQQGDPAGDRQQTADREHGSSDWGWLGLLGLVGLLGLKRRDHDHVDTRTTSTVR